MTYKVLTENIPDAKPRFYIQDTTNNEILYECPTEFVAHEVCNSWNRIGVSYRPDSTLDLP